MREVIMRLTPKEFEDAEHAEILQELVRCKDCKHYERLMHLCRKFDEFGVAESDYCSKAERKEVEE